MALTSVALPVYDLALFVDRDEEVALAADIARRIQAGAAGRPRTLVFHSERGSGKSWLSLHLHRSVFAGIPGVTSLLINFFPPPPGLTIGSNEWFAPPTPTMGHPNYDQMLQQIVEWVAERVEAMPPSGAQLRDLASWVVRDIEQKFKQHVLVLILDSVFEADWELLKRLETHLLAPLAALPHVMTVMTGRGRPFPWKSPYLRVDVVSQRLRAFDSPDIARQLQRQAPAATQQAETIKELGGGHPLSNFLLAQKEDPSEALETVADTLLEVVQPPQRRREVRPSFEALCLLRGFREDEISLMLAAYYNDPAYKEWSDQQMRDERDRLLQTHLMRWEEGEGNFVIDESLRRVLESLLKQQHPDIWRRLQCRAYELYNGWAKRFPKWRGYYQERADRHAQQLRQAGFKPEECPPDELLAPGIVAAHGSVTIP